MKGKKRDKIAKRKMKMKISTRSSLRAKINVIKKIKKSIKNT